MRMPMSCFECHREVAEAGGGEVTGAYWLITLDDDFKYIGACPNGHEVRVALGNVRYELLYDQAIMCLHLGFLREALSGAATALERFFEFACRVMLEHAGINEAIVDRGWSGISRSEPQQGAFLALYLLTFKRAFATPPGVRTLGGMTTPRNNVVHNGWVPDEEEATKYAKEVFEISRAVRKDLESLSNGVDAIRRVEHATGARLSTASVEREHPEPIRTVDGMYRGTTVHSRMGVLSRGVYEKEPTFEEMLEGAVHHTRWWLHALMA
jgi:hypothetical protein